MVSAWQTRVLIGGVVLGVGTFSLSGSTALAQIVPDDTLGGERSQINRNATVRGRLGDRIDGGAIRGVNLFHSFQEFNVNTGQRVYFSNPTGIENILSRVTGNTISDINGTLGVDGAANLFLLNPNGIVFGPNARLDISGSFVGSTGDRFTFGDGSEFSATNPQAPPLLTMRVPVGLQYGTGTITNRGQLTTGQDLTLSGQSLDLQGQLQAGRNLTLQARDTVQIRDSVTTPFIASAGNNLLVQGDRTVNIFALNNPNSGFFSNGDMTLRSRNAIEGDAYYWSGGDFRIERPNGALGGLLSPDDPVIRASGDVTFESYVGASLHIIAGGSVTIPGGILINDVETAANTLQERVPLSNGGFVDIDGSAVPTVDIRAGTTAFAPIGSTPAAPPGFIPAPPSVNGATTGASITIGDIFNLSGAATSSGQVLLTNRYFPNGAPTGTIQTGLISTYGDVTIDSRGDIITGAIDTRTTVSDQIAGDINLLALNGGIRLGGDLLSNVGTGDPDAVPTITGISGDINLLARDDIQTQDIIAISNNSSGTGFSTIRLESLQGSVLLDQVRVLATNFGTQFSGDILIDAGDRIEIVNGSTIATRGNVGRIVVGANSTDLASDATAPGRIVIDNSVLSTSNDSIDPTVAGAFNAGGISLRAIDSIEINNGEINATSARSGNAGDIAFAVPGEFTALGLRVLTEVRSGVTGNSGDIAIAAGSVLIGENSLFQAANLSDGLGGDIAIAADSGSLVVQNSRIVSTVNNNNSSTDAEDYSEIELQASRGSIVLDGTTVTTTNSGTGADLETDADDGIAGDIRINARDRVVIQNQSTVSSQGRLGQIFVGNAIAPATVEIINNPEDTNERYGLIADGFAGRVQITAREGIRVANSRITARSNNDETDSDTFGRIDLTALEGVVLLEDVLLSSTNFGTGFAGDIRLNAEDLVAVIDRSRIFSQGQLGRIFIGGGLDDVAPPQQVIVRGGSTINTNNGIENDSTDQAGDILIRGRDRVRIVNSEITSLSRNDTNEFSNIQVAATEGSVFLNSATLSTTNANTGLAGDISITAPDLISIFNGSEISSEGNFGRILIGNASSRSTFPTQIQIRNTRLSTSNRIDDNTIVGDGEVFGRAGDISLVARRHVSITNPAPTGTVPRFSILSETFGDESAGNILISALRGAVDIEGGFISSRTGIGVSGNGGGITVFGRSLEMRGGTQLSTSTFGVGNAGGVLLNVSNSINLDDVAIFSSAETGSTGNGGVVFVGDIQFSRTGGIRAIAPTQSFTATNGAQLIANTDGSGNAGDVLISARSATFSGRDANGFPSAVFSGVDANGTGRGGNVSILGQATLNPNTTLRSFQPANSLVIRDDALITVSSFGRGDLLGESLNTTRLNAAGNVSIASRLIRLQNNGRIIARTGTGNGGNIRSVTPNSLLLMSGASRISTTAGTQQQPGNGGNIFLRTNQGFAIAQPLGNNDISSDAFQGRGGRVLVDAQGIIGFVNRSRDDIERLLGAEALNEIDPTSQLQTNDITAISQSDAALNGEVTINAVSFDTGSVSALPTDLADASQLIARNCPSEGEQELGEFVVTGRGGLPANPNEILGSEDVLTDWVDPTVETTPTNDPGEPQSNLHTPIVEAQQWVTNSNGEVVLIAAHPTGNVNLNPAACPAPLN